MSIDYIRFPELTIWQRNQIFSVYADEEGSFLLDSGNSDNINGRYDIMAVQPLNVITDEIVSSDSPLESLQEYHQPIDNADIPSELSHLPCIGGTFFALSYDLGRAYETIDEIAKDDLQLNRCYAGVFGCILIIDHKIQCSYLICSNKKSKRIYRELSSKINRMLRHKRTLNTKSFRLKSDWNANFTEEEYAEAFAQVQSYIQAGDCYQVNLAQRFEANCIGSSWQAYCQLSEANNAPFSAFINTGEADILSLSPERFIQLTDSSVETKPIKGTRPRGQTLEADQQLINELLASQKDRAENLMIVDLMRNDLGKTCKPGTIKVPHLFALESFHSVHHLVSTIRGELQENENAYTLLASCFPGGSITGAPKIRAMNIIEQLEPNRRSYYCGSIGYIDSRGNMDSSICIRTLVRKDDKLFCWAGGGLVSDSNQQDEYQETFDKVSRILPVLEPVMSGQD